MDERTEKMIAHYASMVLEWLDIDAKEYHIQRSVLVDQFIDTLNALEQIKEQED